MEPTAFAPPPALGLHSAFGSGSMFEAPPMPSVPQPRLPGRTPKRRGRGGGPPDATALPSLSSMQKSNRRKAKKYYKGRHNPRGRSVPPAPANTNSFLLGTGTTPVVTTGNPSNLQTKFHSRTPNPLNPGTSWKNAPLGPDAEHLLGAIDTYGTNFGLICRKDDAADSFSDNTDSDPEDAMLGYELHMHDREQQQPDDQQLPQQARLRLEEQAAYIADLEEQNMTLREKLFLLEEQLKEAQSSGLQSRERSASPSPTAST